MDEVKSWLISISMTVVAVCLPFAITLLKQWLQAHLTGQNLARASQAADKAGDFAYLALAKGGASIHNPDALNVAIALGQQYMKEQAGDAAAAAGKSDDDMAKMVESRIGAAAKADPTITIGSGVLPVPSTVPPPLVVAP